ncbi:MAG: hypothetical protein IJ015_01515 [Ruminococcus sp.]|nr:hypothetical protein [Ruminococcus sp.]
MTQIESNIDALVKRIKNDDKLKDYTFVKGFSAFDHPNPVSGYLIAVSTLESQVQDSFIGENLSGGVKGSIVDVIVKFRVYSKKNDGGDGLLSVCCAISDAVKNCDTHNECGDIKISSISFDSEADTVYRDVLLSLSFCLCEEVVL